MQGGLRDFTAVLGLVTLAVSGVTLARTEGQTSAAVPLKPVQNILLPGVKGGFDLMAIDMARHRLMVNAEDNGTTEVLDIAGRGARVTTIHGMSAPKWVVYRPELGKMYVANGDGRLRILQARNYAPIATVRLGMLANNLRFDVGSGDLLVGLGDKSGTIAVVDAKIDRVVRQIRLDAFPKQFEIDGDRLYANIPSKNMVQVLNWETGRTLARWPACRSGNVPMALDATGHRLFVGCKEGRMAVLDTWSGRSIASVAIGADPDGIYRDPAHQLLYVSAGQGVVDVLRDAGVGRFLPVQRVTTRPGAGTSLFVAPLHRLFVPLPQSGTAPAAVMAFKTQ